VLWLQGIQLSHMFTSVSITCTAIGLLSEFEAENIYIVPVTSIPQNRNFSDQTGIRFSNIKSHFLFRFLCFQFVSGTIHCNTGIQVSLEVLYVMDLSQTSCYSLNMIHCCSVLLTCCITIQSLSVHIHEFQVTSFGLLTWQSFICVALACFII